jgi:predicted protein tyrosine phosphatase
MLLVEELKHNAFHLSLILIKGLILVKNRSVNILFVCSRNQWRSPTAEAIYKNQSGLSVKSAGTEPSARIKLTAKNILWADILFVMEKKHKQRIIENFPNEIAEKRIVILDIPDEYKFMDEELIEEIKTIVDQYIE